MTITVSSSTIVANTLPSTSNTLAIPSGSSGDTLIIFWAHGGDGSADVSDGSISGWTVFEAYQHGVSYFHVLYKVRGSSESAVTLPHHVPGSTAVAVNVKGPVDPSIWQSTVDAQSSTSFLDIASQVNEAGDGIFFGALVTGYNNSPSVVPPTGFTELQDGGPGGQLGGGDNAQCGLEVCWRSYPRGRHGPFVVGTASPSNSKDKISYGLMIPGPQNPRRTFVDIG